MTSWVQMCICLPLEKANDASVKWVATDDLARVGISLGGETRAKGRW